MSVRDDVLERNLKALFTRSYVPIRASDALRARAHDLVRQALRERRDAHASSAASEPHAVAPSLHERTASQHAVSQQAVSNQAVSNQAASHQAASQRIAPHRSAQNRITHERTATERPAPVRATATRPTRVWALAAAVLVLVGAAFLAWKLGARAVSSQAQLLARGDVAVGIDGVWRAASQSELAHGVLVPSQAQLATLATPAQRAARFDLGSAGRIDVDPHSQVDVARAPSQTATYALVLGGARFERFERGTAWSITTRDTELALARGRLSAADVDARPYGAEGRALRVELHDGVAFAHVDGVEKELAARSSVVFQKGRVLAQTSDAGETSAAGVRTGALPQPNVVAPSSAEPATTCTLRVRVDATALDEDVRSLVVTALRGERLPKVATPIVRSFVGADSFEFTGLAPGTYTVFVEALGVRERTGSAATRAFSADGGIAVAQLEEVTLVAGPAVPRTVELVRGRSLKGRVVTPDGRPAVGALVLAENDVPAQVVPFELASDACTWLASTVTDAQGEFVLQHLSARRHVVRASLGGHAPQWSGAADLIESASFDLGVIQLAPSATLKGRVTHGDGRPWDGALVLASLLDYSRQRTRMGFAVTVADADGVYRLNDLPAGPYAVLNLRARDDSGEGRVVEARLERGAELTVDLGTRQAGVTFRGRLLRSDGRVLANKDVTLDDGATDRASSWRSERSKDDGSFEFRGVTPGRYQVYVGQNLGTDFVRVAEVELVAFADLERDLSLPASSITGDVATVDGGALGGSWLILWTLRDGAWQVVGRHHADPAGRYRFEHMEFGLYKLEAYAEIAGHAPASSAEFSVTAAEPNVVLPLRLSPGARLELSVRDAEGVVGGARVTFFDSLGVERQLTGTTQVDAGGRLSVPGLAAGTWRVQVRAGARKVEESVTLAVGETRVLEIVLPDAAREK